MIELVIVSRLLEYPDAALWQHQQEMFEAIAASKNLPKEDAHALGIFLRRIGVFKKEDFTVLAKIVLRITLPAAIIITHGRITREALTAREILAARGTPVGILLCEYLKPYGKLADEISHKLPAGIPLLFAEEEIRAGGFGMMLTDALRRNGTLAGHPYTILATDDSFVSQDKPESILRTAGVDAEAMVTAIQALLKSN